LSFFAELKRRNVFRVGIVYAVTSWVLLQIMDVVTPILELPAWAPKLIFVILAIGLVPALIFAWAFELTPEGLKREKEVDRAESITRLTGRKLDRTIIGVLAVAVVLLLVNRNGSESQPAAVAATDKSIAVLPFVNMSSDPEQEYFSDGITEEILNSLASVKELKVAGRTSSFAFKGQNEDLRKIGDTLGVDNILEGSVRKANAKVRITAQLIQVEDGFHLWSATYDRELTDVFEIQEEIATEILRQLKATLLAEEAGVFEAQRTDPEVYDLYLLARQRLYSRTRQTIESAAELLDQAIAQDPQYAPALAQRGIAAIMLSRRNYGTIENADADRAAKQDIDRALALDPDLAEGWAALGLYYANQTSEHEAAIEALTRALDLNPNLIDASNWLYIVLSNTGQARAALSLIEDMTNRDPLYRPAFGNGVQYFNNFNQPEKAQALIDRFRVFDPNDPQLLQADAIHHLYRGDAAAAFDLAKRSIQLSPTNNVSRFAWSVALLETLQLNELADSGQDGFRVDALDATGQRDEAFVVARNLEQAGIIEPLLVLLNRAGRSHEVVDYVAERWATLDAFVADFPHDTGGYSIMTELAYAYSRTGDRARFDEAMAYIETALDDLANQGIDQPIFMVENAKFQTLAGNDGAALDWLDHAVKRGLQLWSPLAAAVPAFSSLGEDARFLEIESRMVVNINEDREALGLPAVDPYNEFWK